MRSAVLGQLSRVSSNGQPPSNLPLVVRTAPSQEVTAVPLKPTSRVLVVNPPLGPPHGKGLRRVHTEKVHLGVVSFMAEPSFCEPILRILCGTVSHVFAAEDTKPQHLLRREFGAEARVKIPAYRLRHQVHVALLHQVIDLYLPGFHFFLVGCRLTVQYTGWRPFKPQNHILKIKNNHFIYQKF